MTERVWLNGEIMPLSEAKIGVEDRGYQFADGVYEVIRIYNGRPFTLKEHIDRLARSCDGIDLPGAIDREQLIQEIARFVEECHLVDGMVYVQVTRGVAPRNHLYPVPAPEATVLFYTRQLPPVAAPGTAEGVRLQTVSDERWKRCWVKSIALLANVLAKNAAARAGADEAVFVEDGRVSECSASNLFAVIGGKVVTPPLNNKVLPGITRLVLTQICGQLGIEFVERPLKLEEFKAADELFITSTTRELGWVSHVDGNQLASKCGAVTLKLHQAYVSRVRKETGVEARRAVAV
jgi:D-alanine transaminase